MNAEVNFLNMGRNIDELMRKFKANLHLARRSGEATPASWKEEGDVTLTPSEKMIGKVREYLARQERRPPEVE
jgi:peroxiredoxin (alkyl hydroperoxide reductase subunit C)